MYRNVPCTAAHVAQLLPKLREADATEIRHAGLSPERGLWRSYRGSMFAETVFTEDGEIAAIFGCGGNPASRIGHPWLLTAAVVERHPLASVRAAAAGVLRMLAIYPRLVGKVDADYAKAIRMLEMLGFEIGDPFPFGRYGCPFREFRMERRIWPSV